MVASRSDGITGMSILCMVVLLQSVPRALASVEVGTVRFSMTGVETINWHYASKFGYGLGLGTWSLKARYRDGKMPALESNQSLDLEIFLDERWPGALAARRCSDQQAQFSARKRSLNVGKEWSQVASGKLQQNMRPHIWYFALSRCGGHGFNTTILVDYEIQMKQADGSELSEEHRYMFLATSVALACLSLFLVRFGARCWRFWQCTHQLPPVIRALAASIALQWAGQALHLVHLRFHEEEGFRESSAEAFADVLFMLSQVATSTLLIVLARGYTLLSMKSSELEAAKPTATAIAFLHVLLVAHGKMQGEHAGKHHENGGAVGWALVVVRLLLCVWFLACAQELVHRQHASAELRAFLERFRFAGGLYFLSYPAIYIVGSLCAEYIQHPVIHVGQVVMQTTAVFWFSELFLSRGSSYNQVSNMSMAMLPRGRGGGSPNSEGSVFGSPMSNASSPNSGLAQSSPAYGTPVFGSPHFAFWSHDKSA